ncbi:MAG TPA: hypothetical protein VGS22_10735 [Thermoanaerobaculia bacterium]|jgi:hypothetical protein|nr:hypothetical protein [Thermoanaerobaculia bacterium]
MNEAKPKVEYVKGYSIALLCLGVFLLLGALLLRGEPYSAELASSVTLISSILYLLGFACLTVALLRWARASAALPTTAALSLCFLFSFPLGTGLFIYWLTRVKAKEAIPQDASERIGFNYTVALYIFGLLMMCATLVFRFSLGSAGPEDQLLGFVELGMVGVALAAFGVAALRSTKLRLAHRATFILNILLVFWFPLGTALALVWFFGVRKHDRKLLSEQPSVA